MPWGLAKDAVCYSRGTFHQGEPAGGGEQYSGCDTVEPPGATPAEAKRRDTAAGQGVAAGGGEFDTMEVQPSACRYNGVSAYLTEGLGV